MQAEVELRKLDEATTGTAGKQASLGGTVKGSVHNLLASKLVEAPAMVMAILQWQLATGSC